jgi:hypothetical protein
LSQRFPNWKKQFQFSFGLILFPLTEIGFLLLFKYSIRVAVSLWFMVFPVRRIQKDPKLLFAENQKVFVVPNATVFDGHTVC